jgi:hypothetical protein
VLAQEFDEGIQLKQAQELNADNRVSGGDKSEKMDEDGDAIFRFSREGKELSIFSDVDDGKPSDSKISAKRSLSQRREKGSQQLQLNEQLERQKSQSEGELLPAKPADAPNAAPEAQKQAAPQSSAVSGRDARSSGRGGARFGTLRNRVMSNAPARGGRGVGGGGGFGGGAFGRAATIEGEPADERKEETAAGGKPLAPGGLSLRVMLEPPAGSQKLVFSKPGGSPRLAVAVRPKESLQTGLGSLWALVWLVLGACLVAAFGGAKARPEIRRHLAKVVAAVGLVAFLILPAPLNWLGLAVFAVALAIALRRQAAAA